MKTVRETMIHRILRKSKLTFTLYVANTLLCGFLFVAIERTDENNLNPLMGAYWAVVTASTTGYGDISPKTVLGILLTIYFMISMWLLNLVMQSHVTAAVFEAQAVFTNDEQESNEAALLALLKHNGLVPREHKKMPPPSWWAEHHDFEPDYEK